MNKSNAQIKGCAKQNLLGHYGTVIGAIIIVALLTLLLNIPFNNMTQQGIYYGAVSRILLGGLGSLIVLLIIEVLNAGISYIHLQIARGQKTQLKEMFFTFRKRPDRYIGYGLLTVLLSVVCVMPGYLCVMPLLAGSESASALALGVLGITLMIIGTIVLIIIFLSWSMTVFILLDDSNIRVMDAIRKSRRMMRGYKGRIFLLGLSFIGWIIFSVLSLFLALLWIVPYLSQSRVCFYLELLPNPTQNMNQDDNPYTSAR